MKLVSPALLIEALAVRFPSAAMALCELEDVCDFITEYAADQGIDLPLKLVIGQMSEGADLFNPASDTPLTPEQYRRLYVEDTELRCYVNEPAVTREQLQQYNPRSLSHGMVNRTGYGDVNRCLHSFARGRCIFCGGVALS